MNTQVARPLRIGVVGPGATDASPANYETAREIGALLAARSAVVVCGGLGGVMEGAARGAVEAGGVTLGILPGNDDSDANPWITYPIPTGIGEARNFTLVNTCEALIAVGINAGTSIEVVAGSKANKPTFLVRGDPIMSGSSRLDQGVLVQTPREAVAAALQAASTGRVA